MDLKSSAPLAPGAPRSSRGWLWLGAAGVSLLVLVGIGLGWRAASSVPPIPAPANLGLLDAQVRSHLVALAKLAAASPRDGQRRSELGLALAVNGLWTEARSCFLDAIQLGDNGSLPRMYAAVALQEMGDAPGASKELQQVIERFPDAAPAWYRLGVARVTLGELGPAEEAFHTVTRLVPTEWRGWAGVGEARLRQGRHADAVEPLERAVSLDPFARSAYHLLGQAYRGMGRTHEAATALAAGSSQTVGPMPDGWSIKALSHMRLLPDQFERSDALMAEGQFIEATARLREALRFHPTNVSVIVRLARALTASEKAPDAGSLLAQARDSIPDSPGLLTASAEVAAAMGRGQEALEWARRAVAVAPQLPEVHVAEANAWLALENDAAAAAALEKALERAPTDVGLLVQLGDLEWHNLGRRESASQRYQAAHRADPIHPPTLKRLAALAIDRREFDDAERHLAELRRLRMDPAEVGELDGALRRAKGPQ